MYLLCCQICNVYSEDIDIKDLEKYFLASSQGQAPGFSPKNFITSLNRKKELHFVKNPLILNVFSYMQNGIFTDLEGKGMGQNASGMYIIDDNYNIVGFNKVAEHMYPRIKKEEKCYRCLMNQEVPCAMCPIYNKIEGPKTYIDPVSGHYETVDAVDMDLPDGTHGHALIFGFAAEDGQKAVNEPLPANKEGLGLTSIINVLGSDYRSIYSVDRKTQ